MAAAKPGDRVRVEGEVALLGEMYCPCFHLVGDGIVVVVWYDLMIDAPHSLPPVDVGAIANGMVVGVDGELRPQADPGTGFPVVWATAVTAVAG